MGLREKLKEIKEGAVARIPPDALEVIGRTTQQLVESGQAERSLAVGARIPSFSLETHDGETITSDDLIARSPLVLMFYRGVW